MNHKNRIKVLLIVLVIVVAGIVYSCVAGAKSRQAAETVRVEETESSAETVLETETEEAKEICVHVCGSVNAPGVYYLKKGARVHEAVEQAGGLSENADPGYVNLAEEVEDGEQIYIPSKEEVAADLVPKAESGQAAADGLVNINTAGVEELKTLPGIGEIKAEAIVSYRESAGAFGSIEEIMNVAGIKESSYEKIKEFIKV